MILARLMGGLGNQMFQYAFGKRLSLKYAVPLKLDISLLGEDKTMPDLVLRNFDLDIFKLADEFATKDEIEKFNGKPNPDLLDRATFRMNKIINRYPLVVQQDRDSSIAQMESIGQNACIVGRWQSENYFKQYELEIRRLFSFQQFFPNAYSLSIADRMKNNVPVSIHVRRSDYVTHPVYSKMLGGLDKQYYLDAISFMNKKLSNAEDVQYFFISDDMEWCKANFGAMENATFVEQESGKTGYASDLWLLTQCKHAIISNSTFAWWGAWLGERGGSVIIAPLNWNKKKIRGNEDRIPERWIKIENSFG